MYDPEGARLRAEAWARHDAEQQANRQTQADRAQRIADGRSTHDAIAERMQTLNERYASPRGLSAETAAAQQEMREQAAAGRPSIFGAVGARLAARAATQRTGATA